MSFDPVYLALNAELAQLGFKSPTGGANPSCETTQ